MCEKYLNANGCFSSFIHCCFSQYCICFPTLASIESKLSFEVLKLYLFIYFVCARVCVLLLWINDLMSQALGQVAVLNIICIMLKQSLAFFPFLSWGIKVYGKFNIGKLRVQEALSDHPDAIYVSVFLSYIILSLFLLSNIF